MKFFVKTTLNLLTKISSKFQKFIQNTWRLDYLNFSATLHFRAAKTLNFSMVCRTMTDRNHYHHLTIIYIQHLESFVIVTAQKL